MMNHAHRLPVLLLPFSVFLWISCGSDKATESEPPCPRYSIAGLSTILAEREDARSCVSLVGQVQFRSVRPRCPGGGWYFSDSTGEALYLHDWQPEGSQFPEDTTLAIPAIVEADYLPNEVLCGEYLCHCQRGVHVRNVVASGDPR